MTPRAPRPRPAIAAAIALIAALIAATAPRAAAQALPALPPEYDDRPWAAGIPDAEQAAAREVYLAGNREFAESRFAQALAKYREAIRHWDHPAIRYNIVVCLINLDQPVDAMDNLERSLAFGPAALGNEAYAQALTYRKLLDAQLTRVTAVSSEPGAEVTLDGKYLFTAPGSANQVVRPGDHQLAATKPGFSPLIRRFVGVAGNPVQFALQPERELPPAAPVQRWPHWKYLAAGGAVIAAAGAASYLWARSDFAAYDSGVEARCPKGCSADQLSGFPELQSTKARAGTKQIAAFALLSAGGAAAITGVLGLVLDPPRVPPRVPSRTAPVPAIALTPGGATLAVGWAF